MRSTTCHGDQADGHLGYLLHHGTRLGELHPPWCPRGHPLRYPNIGVSWSAPGLRTYSCDACYRAREPKAILRFCPCWGDRILAGETYIPWEVDSPEWAALLAEREG